MKCKHCDGDGVIVDVEYGHAGKYMCDYCWGTGVVEPLTEQEYLQTCTTEQLAEWICSVREKCYYCGAKNISDRENCPFGDGKCRNNKHEFIAWLKQPHTIKE